mgnify:CR=1 FL=1
MVKSKYPHTLSLLVDVDFWPADAEDAIDLEIYPAFLPAEEVTEWIRAWSGNDTADGGRFHVFGQDGSGGYAALYDEGGATPVEELPVVFLGSEGEIGTVAANLSDFLALLAQGTGPAEVVEIGGVAYPPLPEVVAIHDRVSDAPPATPEEISERARLAAPGFEPYVQSLLN